MAQQGLFARGLQAYNNDINTIEAQLPVDGQFQIKYICLESLLTVQTEIKTDSRYRQIVSIANLQEVFAARQR